MWEKIVRPVNATGCSVWLSCSKAQLLSQLKYWNYKWPYSLTQYYKIHVLMFPVFYIPSFSSDAIFFRTLPSRQTDISYSVHNTKKVSKCIYIALIFVVHTRHSGMDHQFYLQLDQCLHLSQNHSPDGASPGRLRTSNCSLLLIYRPRRDERLSWPSWLIYSGLFTHISGHPSAVGGVQDRESSPVRDQCSTSVPYNQLSSLVHRK